MILKVFLGLTELLKAQIFYIYKVIKIIIIYKDKYLIFATF